MEWDSLNLCKGQEAFHGTLLIMGHAQLSYWKSEVNINEKGIKIIQGKSLNGQDKRNYKQPKAYSCSTY